MSDRDAGNGENNAAKNSGKSLQFGTFTADFRINRIFLLDSNLSQNNCLTKSGKNCDYGSNVYLC